MGKFEVDANVYHTQENGYDVEKIAIQHADILGGGFRDFVGTVNSRGTLVRSFCVEVPEEIVPYLKEHDIPVSTWEPKEDPDGKKVNIVKFLINFSAMKDEWKPLIQTKEGDDGDPVKISEPEIHLLQTTKFTDSLITARITHGVYMNKPYTHLYVSRAAFTKMKAEVNGFERDMFAGFDAQSPADYDEEELPFS